MAAAAFERSNFLRTFSYIAPPVTQSVGLRWLSVTCLVTA